MGKIILLFVVSACLAGCEPSVVRDGRNAYMVYFKETLKDPESLRIYHETILEQNNIFAKFKVEIGATNSYGAYVRETYKFHTKGSQIIEVVDGESTLGVNQEPKPTPTPDPPKTVRTVPNNDFEYVLAEYKEYIANSDVMGTFSVGEIITLKTPILAANSGTHYSFLINDIKNNKEEDFNEHFSWGYYKLLPKGIKIRIEQVYNESKKNMVEMSSDNPEDCLRIKIITSKLKGEVWFIGKFIKK